MSNLAPTLMVMGTASSVGKSLLVTGLGRALSRRGIRVAPFKAQNMALNSYVTAAGLEIGRAQAVQAEACKALCDIRMNPVLLKPEGERTSQVVINGKVQASMSAAEYHQMKPQLRELIVDSLNSLRADYDVVLIEGAGSPAEINLKSQDIVNMFVAQAVESPVILVGDIDRGGVFASFVGTWALLSPEERGLIKGFVINKFRGDLSLLTPGYSDLLERTGIPVLGTLPYLRDLRVAEEDSLALDRRPNGFYGRGDEIIDIAILRLPRLSNYDEFQPLEYENDVWVRYVSHPRELKGAHLVIVPGSKKTLSDLRWMRERGFFEALKQRADRGERIMGVCGGCQILGESISDPLGVEGEVCDKELGVGLLPVSTHFEKEKVVARVKFSTTGFGFFADAAGSRFGHGYEIHMGRLIAQKNSAQYGKLKILERNGEKYQGLEGAVSADGMTIGTLIHGLFEDDGLRQGFLDSLRLQLNIPSQSMHVNQKEEAYNRLADAIDQSLDCEMIDQLISRNL